MVKTISRLPPHLQSKWRHLAVKQLKSSTKYPDLKNWWNSLNLQHESRMILSSDIMRVAPLPAEQATEQEEFRFQLHHQGLREN